MKRMTRRAALHLLAAGPWLRARAFDLAPALPPETKLYGEGFQMLSQTGGTIGRPADLGDYTDARHYRMPQPADATVAYNLVLLGPPGEEHRLLGFTSCRRFSGRFELRPATLGVVIDTEARELGPGQEWELEEFAFLSGGDREALLAALGDRIGAHHPPLRADAPPAGWCSWYCFGPRVVSAHRRSHLLTSERSSVCRWTTRGERSGPAQSDTQSQP